MGIGSKLILGSPSSRAKQTGAERSAWRVRGSAWRVWGGGDAETTVYGASMMVQERRLQHEALRVQTEASLEEQRVKYWTCRNTFWQRPVRR